MIGSKLNKTLRVGPMMFLVVALLLATSVGTASAHARLQSATIAPDAVIATVPASLSITFNEEPTAEGSRVAVLDASGKNVDKGDAKFAGDTVTVGLNTLTDGKYTVKYRTYTEDDNGILDGEYSFTVAKSGTATTGSGKPTEQTSTAPAQAPATGGGATAQNESGLSFTSVAIVVALLTMSVAGTVLVRRRRYQGK